MNFIFRRLQRAAQGLEPRTLKVLVTAGAAYFGKFGQGIAVLITLPMARQSLHPELFGVWMMLSALLGFMAFADMGIGNGVLNQTTKARAAGDTPMLNRTVVSGYGITSAVAVCLYGAWQLWVLSGGEPSVIAGSVSAENQPKVMDALAVFAALFAINIPASLIQRIQLGTQQGYWNGINQSASALLMVMAVPLSLHLDAGVPGMVLATLGVQTFVNIANTLVWLHRNNALRLQTWLESLHMPTAGELLRAGSLFFLLQLAAAFAFQSDSIVISHTLGPSAYGDFAVVQKLFLFISTLLSAAMLGLWPAFGDAMAKNNMVWVKKTLRRSMLLAFCLTLAGTGALCLAMPWVLKHWLKGSIQPSWGLMMALSAWTVIDGVANVAAAFLNGANLIRAQLILAVGMAATAFALKWVLTPLLGVAGAVLSTIVAYCVISVPGQIYIFKQAFKSQEPAV